MCHAAVVNANAGFKAEVMQVQSTYILSLTGLCIGACVYMWGYRPY